MQIYFIDMITKRLPRGKSEFLGSPTKKISKQPFNDSVMDEFDDYDAELVGQGASAAVLGINKDLVIKVFANSPDRTRDLDREVQIFKKLSDPIPSDRIVHFVATWNRGIIMERLQMTLRYRLSLLDVAVELEDRWTLEVSEGLEFLHSKDIIHGDLGCQNVLIDSKDHAKICDFAGSRIEDEVAWARYQVRYQHPRYVGKQPNVVTDIFALGSVIFEIATLRPPYERLLDTVVQERFLAGEFPLEAIDRPEIQEVVERCWNGTYVQVSDICQEMRRR